MTRLAKPRAWIFLGACLILAATAAGLLVARSSKASSRGPNRAPATAAAARRAPGDLFERLLSLGRPPVAGQIPAPELEGGTKWLNSQPLKMAQVRGKVVLVDFWEYTCVNCLRTLPYMKEWHNRYADKGLVIIGVHTPEFQFARVEANVEAAAREFGLKYPIVVDSDYAIWKAYGNRFWPAKYLSDARGFVRFYHFGEGDYGRTEQQIQELLREINPRVELPRIMEPIRPEDGPGKVCYPVTPELYAGYLRGASAGTLGNPGGYRPDQEYVYRDSGAHDDGRIYLHGGWKNTAEACISTRKSSYPRDWLAIRYHAIEVNSVMRPEDGTPVRVWLYQDGKPVAEKNCGQDVQSDEQGRSYVLVDKPRMYSLIKNAAFGKHDLKLATAQPGLGIYSFTFVSCVAR